MSITPKNWTSFQHYKDRSPAWIKLHRGLLDDYTFSRLPVASRALAPLLWLLASEYTGGEITATPDELAFRFRMTPDELLDALSPLIESGFFYSSETLADCKQDAIPEKRRETRIEREEERETRARDLPSALPEDFKLTEAELEAAHNIGMANAVIDAELKIFKAKKRSAGTKSADWSSEWTIWCERWKALKPAQSTSQPPPDRAALDWDKQLGRFKKGLPWTTQHWGPEPGQLGCWAPPELLTKHGFEIPTSH